MNTLEWNKIKSVVTLSGDTQDAIDVTKILTKEVLDFWRNMIVWWAQCRVTLSVYLYFLGLYQAWVFETPLHQQHEWLTALSFLILFVWFAGTGAGMPTATSYYRTIKHIEKMGTLWERYFKSVMGADTAYPRQWYCQLQGMYLACRAMEKKYPWLKKKCLEYRDKHTRNQMPLG